VFDPARISPHKRTDLIVQRFCETSVWKKEDVRVATSGIEGGTYVLIVSFIGKVTTAVCDLGYKKKREESSLRTLMVQPAIFHIPVENGGDRSPREILPCSQII